MGLFPLRIIGIGCGSFDFPCQNQPLHFGREGCKHHVHILLGAWFFGDPFYYEHQVLQETVTLLGLVKEFPLLFMLQGVLFLNGSQILLLTGIS